MVDPLIPYQKIENMSEAYSLGCQNVSGEILSTMLKFHEKIPGLPGDIKSFRPGEGCRVGGIYTFPLLPYMQRIRESGHLSINH